MPMYDWKDEASGRTVAIIRTFDDSDKGPDREDVPEMSDTEWSAAQWKKVLAAPQWQRGGSWRGGKGYW